MIAITISAEAYAVIAANLSAAEQEIAADREYRIWLPRAVVERLRALREPGETFSDVILRLAERGSFSAIAR
jgi:hypothetical protein